MYINFGCSCITFVGCQRQKIDGSKGDRPCLEYVAMRNIMRSTSNVWNVSE